jgi:hypothetical protein
VHRRLSVLPGPFTPDVALALAAPDAAVLPAVEGDAVPDLLAFLVHRSLLVSVAPETPTSSPRFRQLATVRGHARRALVLDGEAAHAEDARDRWVHDLVGLSPRPFGPDNGRWHDRVDDDYDAVRGTLHRLLVEAPQPAGVAVVTRLGGYWYLRRRLVEGLSWLELAAAIPDADPVDAAEVQCALAVRLVLQGRTDLALPHLERARAGLALDVPAERLSSLAWALAGLAYALLTGSERGLVPAITADVREVAAATGDTDLTLAVDALALTTATPPDPAAVQEAYQRAIEQDATFAALVCTSFFSLFALLTADPALGRLWVERGRELHERVGGRAFSGFDENRANFASMAGEHETAAALYGASSAAAYRDGTVWPRQAPSRDLLRRTEAALTREQFLDAWRAGEQGVGA